MKNIAILVPETAVIEAVADPRYLFTAVNQFLHNAGQTPLFNIQLIGQTPDVRLAEGTFTVHCDATLETAFEPDLIIIPAISVPISNAIEANKAFYPWVVQAYERGTEVASLCLGAFLLASTGLLRGQSCSTHWLFANEFRQLFPEVNLTEHKIICEHKGVYSSGGANSYWNLLLHLVEKYTNREMAILASKFFVLNLSMQSQSPFAIFNGQKMHDDAEIRLAQTWIENNYTERITIDTLCEQFNIGRRTFERRFSKATHNTPIEYLQRVRIEAAKKQLETGSKNINEVMFDVGYADTKAFRDVFKKIAGMTPADYRNRYNKEAG